MRGYDEALREQLSSGRLAEHPRTGAPGQRIVTHDEIVRIVVEQPEPFFGAGRAVDVIALSLENERHQGTHVVAVFDQQNPCIPACCPQSQAVPS